MSNSYKHTPGFTEGYGSPTRKFFKRCSNKKMRRTHDLPNGNTYKKNGYTYDIADYRMLYFVREQIVSPYRDVHGNRVNQPVSYPCYKDIMKLYKNKPCCRK